MRMETATPEEREMLLRHKCSVFDNHPFVSGPPLNKRRVAIVSTAALVGRHDRPFSRDPDDFYRVIPGDVQANDLVMSHMSTGFDRTAYLRDWNVVFPLDRLREMVAEGVIGSVADFHYSYNSSKAKPDADRPIREIASLLKKDKVNSVLLFPV